MPPPVDVDDDTVLAPGEGTVSSGVCIGVQGVPSAPVDAGVDELTEDRDDEDDDEDDGDGVGCCGGGGGSSRAGTFP